jgi:hypothetical protein
MAPRISRRASDTALVIRKVSADNKKGRAYSRPTPGTDMPSKERFQHAPAGACF